MSGSSNQSLVNSAKLISSNFTLRDRQFAGNLAAYLNERINERRTIAVGGDASAGFSKKTNRAINAGIFTATTVVAAGITVATAGIAAPIIVGVAGAGAAVATSGAGLALKKLVKAIPKRKIKRNAEIYNNYLPEENSDTIKLFAQLVSLSMTKKLQTALIAQEKPSVLNPMLKVMDNAIDEIARVRKISRQDEKEAVQKLANAEFSEIWDIFKEFTRDNAQYALTPSAETITNLLAKHCDLGDQNDKSEIVSVRERNALWINIFARYLEGKDEAVRESVLSTLNSKFNVIPELPLSNIPSSTSLSSECSSSSGIGSNDSYALQTRESHSPKFFARKAETLAANQPEPGASLSLNTRL